VAQRSAHPARQLAPREELHLEARPDLRRDQHPDQHPDLHLEAARHAPVRPALSELRLREASLVPCFLPQEAWPPELAQVVPVVRLAGAVHLHQAGCLFGAYPQAASARLGQPEQQARSSPPEVSAEACVRVVPRSEESAVAQPLVERLWAVPASDAAAARQQAAEVAASDAAVVPRQAAEVAVLVAAAGPQQAAEAAVLDVAAEPQQAAEVAVLDAAAEPQQAAEGAALVAAAEPQQAAEVAALDAAAGPQQVAVAAVPGVAAEPRPEAVLDAAVLLPAAQGVQAAATAGVSSAFRRGRHLPWPAPRRAGRFAHAMRRPQIASPSERSWQAARCEGLS